MVTISTFFIAEKIPVFASLVDQKFNNSYAICKSGYDLNASKKLSQGKYGNNISFTGMQQTIQNIAFLSIFLCVIFTKPLDLLHLKSNTGKGFQILEFNKTIQNFSK